MSADFDVSSLLGLYLDEATEQIAKLESAVLAMNGGPDDAARVGDAFLFAHTIKGASRTMGFDPIASVAHHLEDELEMMRAGQGLTPDLHAALLKGVDALRRELEKLRTPMETHRFSVRLDGNCALPSIRAELLLRELEKVATVVRTVPERSALDQFDFTVELQSTETPEQLEAVALNVPEVREFKSSAAAAQPSAKQAETTLRIPISRIEHSVRLAGELMVERARLQRIAADADRPDLLECADRISALIRELQSISLAIRMVPIEGLFRRVVRQVHELAQTLGKNVDVFLEGTETEVDRNVLEALADPLIHLIRNSLDHGLETSDVRQAKGKLEKGRISLGASAQDGEVIVRLSDDGVGIDPDRLRRKAVERGMMVEPEAQALSDTAALELIFHPGFSTAASLSEISGRGVGMELVRACLERLGGRIAIASEVGKGTTFTLSVPISVSVVRCLVVRCGSASYALPETCIKDITMFENGFTSEAYDLASMLEGNPAPPNGIFGVAVREERAHPLLSVDQLVAEEDLVVKPLVDWLTGCTGISGAAIDAAGKVVLVVDPIKVLETYAATR